MLLITVSSLSTRSSHEVSLLLLLISSKPSKATTLSSLEIFCPLGEPSGLSDFICDGGGVIVPELSIDWDCREET